MNSIPLRIVRIVTLVLLSAAVSLRGQGTFQNLDFEAAILHSLPPGQYEWSVASSDALPGWRVFFGEGELSAITHNLVSVGAVNVSVLGPQFPPVQILDGAFTALLQGGYNTGGTSASIAQIGLIPVDAQSLQFKAAGMTLGDFGVFVGGQRLGFALLSATSNYSVFGAQISEFAGAASELRFTSFRPSGGPTGYVLLDDIQFSTEPIPEPTSAGMFALATLLLVWRLCKRTSSLLPRLGATRHCLHVAGLGEAERE